MEEGIGGKGREGDGGGDWREGDGGGEGMEEGIGGKGMEEGIGGEGMEEGIGGESRLKLSLHNVWYAWNAVYDSIITNLIFLNTGIIY